MSMTTGNHWPGPVTHPWNDQSHIVHERINCTGTARAGRIPCHMRVVGSWDATGQCGDVSDAHVRAVTVTHQLIHVDSLREPRLGACA
jgi:hypothetical protein